MAVERRGLIIAVTLLIAVSLGLCLPKLQIDTSPANLVNNLEGQQKVERRFEAAFGDGGTKLLVALSAADVLSDEAVLIQLRLAQRLKELPEVVGLKSLVNIAFSHPDDEPELQVSKSEGGIFSGSLFEKYAAREGETATARTLRLKEERLAEAFAKMPKGAPDRATWQAIVDAEPGLYPDGLVTLLSRLREQGTRPRSLLRRAQEDGEASLALDYFRASLLRLPGLVPLLLSEDHAVTPLVLTLSAESTRNQNARLATVARIRAELQGIKLGPKMRLQLGGVPVLHEAVLAKVNADRRLLNPLMGIVCLLILGITFRWWPAVVAPISAVLVTAIATLGTMALLGQPLTILTNIITPLLLIVGLSDSVHLIGRYREELRYTNDRKVAGQKAVRAMMSACFLTSLTTAFGFASLATARTPELRSFGLTAAGGVLGAYLATVFFVPAFITLFKAPPPDQRAGGQTGFVEGSLIRLTRWVLKYAKLIAIGSAFLALGLSYGASKVKADAHLLDAFESREPVYQLTTLLQEKLGGVRPLEVMLRSPGDRQLLTPEVAKELARIQSDAVASGAVITSTDYLQPLTHLNNILRGKDESTAGRFASVEQLNALYQVLAGQKESALQKRFYAREKQANTPELQVGRMTFYLKDIGVQGSLAFLENLEEQLRQALPPEMEISFTGQAYVGSKGRSFVLRDLLGGLALALGTIFVLLVILFRSLRFGLVAIPPNVIPLFATGAYMLARGMELQITTVITFSIGIGLAVDDTIHVVARFREELSKTKDVDEAIIKAAAGTGRAIVVTACSLCLGFSVLLLSEFVSVRQFAELICVTVVNCLIAALVIQPALLKLAISRSSTEN